MQEYRTNDIFRDKTVLVIGNQFSAADVAADASRVAKQVQQLLKFNCWIGPFHILSVPPPPMEDTGIPGKIVKKGPGNSMEKMYEI